MNQRRRRRGLQAAMAFAIALPLTASIAQEKPGGCAGDGSGITLPSGFCATVFADNLGHARHLAVAPNGIVYVNTWSGVYYHNDKPPPGGFLVALRDTKGRRPGRCRSARFGESVATGGQAAPASRLYNGGALRRDQRSHRPLSLGRQTRSCPTASRKPSSPACRSPAIIPCIPSRSTPRAVFSSISVPRPTPARRRTACRESPGINLARNSKRAAASGATTPTRRASIFSPNERFATGLRNGEGSAFDAAGRHLCHPARPRPAFRELAAALHAGTGRKSAGRRAGAARARRRFWLAGMLLRRDPAKARARARIWRRRRQERSAFARKSRRPSPPSPPIGRPNDMLIYNGTQFPAAYRGGAFIAFHGSWNRAPLPQGGYNVVFQPLANGKASGPLCRVRRRFCGRRQGPQPRGVPARRARHRAGRRALRCRTMCMGASGASLTMAAPA